MTRAEHLAWAKQRALQCVDAGDLAGAVASMFSDLAKHDSTRLPVMTAGVISMAGMMEVQRGPDAVRHWIEGF